MKRLFLAIPAMALLCSSAFAQTVSPDATKDMWCGSALVIVFSTPPADATDQQKAEAQQFIDGGNMLVERATAAHKAAGFSDDQITKVKADLATKLQTELQGDGSTAEFTFDDCTALLPAGTVAAPAAPAAPDAMAPAPDAMAPAAPADSASSSAAQ